MNRMKRIGDMSLKGSDRCYLRHRRRMTAPATSSLSLKGSDRCRSLSGCWPSCEAIVPQGAAHRVNLSRHSVPSHCTIWSLNVALSQPFSLSENPISIAHGVAFEHYLLRHSVPHSNATSFGSRQSLKGSDRYSLRHRRRICAATSTLRSPKGSYVYCRWHRHWQMGHTATIPSLKGSDKYGIIYSHNLQYYASITRTSLHSSGIPHQVQFCNHPRRRSA